MRSDITEFSYGYALTSNLMDLQPSGIAPIFPNLYQEGTEGGGYDVELPQIEKFLQFKLSEHMIRSSALHAAIVGIPHYRFELRPSKYSQQHALLLDLEAQGKEVYYCAPEFHNRDDLNEAFGAVEVPAKSAAFSPADIGELPDDGDHYVAFRRSRGRLVLF